MKIEFSDESIKDLYVFGVTKDRRYKHLSRDKKFLVALAKIIDLIYSFVDVTEFKLYSNLHYEKLKHRPESSIRIINGRVERLIFIEHENKVEVKLIEIDLNHYGTKR